MPPIGNHTRRGVLRGVGVAVAGAGVTGVASGMRPDRVEVNVGYSDATGRRAALSAADAVVREFAFGAATIRVSERALDGLRRRPDVRYVEENGQMYALHHRDGHDGGPGNDDGGDGGGGGSTNQRLPWGIDRVDAEVAHANGATGAGVDVAILDTGIDSDHPDLQANLGAGVAIVEAKGNFAQPWDDDNDHGTHCAGTAAAIDNGEGVVGVAPGATLHAVKVLDKRGSGTFSDIAAGLEAVADRGWDVASMSLGASSGSSVVADACAYADGAGVFLVAAAGNSGPCTDCVGYPAAYPECVAVSATASDDSLSGFSSTGSEVEIAAPGSDVESTVPGGYATFSGTSMATPHVAGAAGQLMADGVSNAQARSTLGSSAQDLGLASTEQGAGLLDVAAALGYSSGDD